MCFSAYGEGVFLVLQTSLVLFLVLYYARKVVSAFLFVLLYSGSMAFLLSSAAPVTLVEAMQGVNILIVIASKVSISVAFFYWFCFFHYIFAIVFLNKHDSKKKSTCPDKMFFNTG